LLSLNLLLITELRVIIAESEKYNSHRVVKKAQSKKLKSLKPKAERRLLKNEDKLQKDCICVN
jgi:hypothetical protein